MKYLIIDDTPEHLKPLAQALRESGHTVVFARDIGTVWGWLERGDRFNLIAIDLALDRRIEEFAKEQSIIAEGLTKIGLADLPMSGQALGLRLWCQRKKLEQRYCYITHHKHLYITALDQKDPEFANISRETIEENFLLDKSAFWPNNVVKKFQEVCEIWDQQKWLS